MRVYVKFILIYLISHSRWILAESGESSTSKTGVDLDITSESSTNEFEYKKDGQYVTYTAEDTKAFQLVKDGITEVWKASDNNYSDRVEVDNIFADSKAVTICLDGGQTKIFKKDYQNTKWEEIDLTIVNPKPINIKYESESYFYTNTIDDKGVRTFEAKNGFCFNGSNEYIGDNKVEIWKTTNENEYANKIVNEGGNKVTIYIGEGTTASTKIFKKGTYGKWQEDNSEPESSSSETEEKSTSGGSSGTWDTITGWCGSSGSGGSCGWSCMWNKITGWFSSIRCCNSCSCCGSCGSSNESSETGTGTSGLSSSCTSSGTWDTIKGCLCCGCCKSCGSSNESSETDTGASGWSSSCGSCNWDTIKGWFSSIKWCNSCSCCGSCGLSTSKTGVDLNITSESSTNEFEYKKDGQYVTYTAKDNYAFKLVKDDSIELWEESDASNYSLRIEVDLINNDAKAVTVYLDENKTKVFKKDRESDPWNEINTTIVNPKSINIDYPYESYFYKNTLDNNLRTFIPKTGFVFNIVYRFIDENRVIIWKTNDEKEYTNKVVTEGNNKITIYIGDDGTAKVFNKGSDGKWAETTS